MDKIRDFDKYAAKVSLTNAGKKESGTLLGGLCSICLTLITLAYFCMRLIDVVSHQDPSISSFTINENRSQMEDDLSLG